MGFAWWVRVFHAETKPRPANRICKMLRPSSIHLLIQSTQVRSIFRAARTITCEVSRRTQALKRTFVSHATSQRPTCAEGRGHASKRRWKFAALFLCCFNDRLAFGSSWTSLPHDKIPALPAANVLSKLNSTPRPSIRRPERKVRRIVSLASFGDSHVNLVACCPL